MKKGLIFLGLVLTVVLSACTKETSLEKALLPTEDNTWSFTMGSREYRGVVNKVYIMPNTVNFTVIEGPNSNNSGLFSVGFGQTPTLEVGEYPSPFGQIVYVEAPDNTILSDNEEPSFKVVITEINEERIVGTFSGNVTDQDGIELAITNGRFSALR